MKVFAINGISLAGKDTFCNFVSESCDMGKIVTISTIDPIKNFYSDLGWNGIKSDMHRSNLNILKQMWISNCNGPHEWTIKKLKELQSLGVEIAFVMVREFDEMMDVVEIGKKYFSHGQTIQIIRHGLPIPKIEQEFLDSHPKDYQYNWTIVNPNTMIPEIPKLALAAKAFYSLSSSGLGADLVWNPEDEIFTTWLYTKVVS